MPHRTAATRASSRPIRSPRDHPSSVTLNGTRDTLYFINRDVWRMRVDAEELPVTPFLPYTQTTYYEVAVDPLTSEVYADAIDYVQHGFTASRRGARLSTRYAL